MRLWVAGGLLLLGWARHRGTFVENKGQVYPEARYEAVWRNHRIYLTPTGLAILLVDDKGFHEAHWNRWGDPKPVKAHFFRIHWIQGRSIEPQGESPEPTRYNFFQGTWRATNAQGFHEVWYRGVYPGVDVRFRLTEEGLKWDWLVSSAEALAAIRLWYEGVSISAEGDSLRIETGVGTFIEKLPRVYLQGSNQSLKARYRIEGKYVSYELLEKAEGKLVVDPVVVFSTFSGSYSDNWGFTATYDLQGNAFGGGNVNDMVWNANPGGMYFPVTPGVVQGTFGGGVNYSTNTPIFWGTDIALWKANPTGTTILWATYLGGSDNEQPHSLVTDAQGNLYLMGASRSSNYPTSPNAYQPTYHGNIDIVISCISANGDQLLGSTYLGGSGEDGLNSRLFPLYYFYADDGRGEIILGDTACYVISSTRSTDFPTTPNAYQKILRGGMDAVICKLSLDLRQLYASTFLGGTNADAGYSIRVGGVGYPLDVAQQYGLVER
ncbi:MAG: SBBP repeat-containing protein, partial [Bacteroidia bacterium]|nr:SBBP repeat-containing protein [Bacteroidia bacterium]